MRPWAPVGEEAISPVIGVVLMVSITVVLAGVVLIMLQRFGSDPADPAGLTFIQDESRDRLTVVKADQGLVLSDFQVRLSVDGDFAFDAPPAPPADLPAGSFVSMGDGDPIGGGAIIYVCTTAPAENVLFAVRHITPNTFLYQATFLDVHPC